MQQINSMEARTTANGAYLYDYVTVETNDKFAMEYVDCYEVLGFELVKTKGLSQSKPHRS